MAEERLEEKEEKMEGTSKELSRKKFLAGAAALAAGAVATGGILGAAWPGVASSGIPVKLLVNGKEITGPIPPRIVDGATIAPVRPVAESMGAQVVWESTSKTVRINSGGVVAAPAWPWAYTKLDPAVVSKKGYDGYYEGACCYGVVKAIVTELRDKIGYPYTMLPVDMFRYGEGGVVGWSTLCGALNGACAVVNLVAGEEVYKKVVNELVGWYTQYPFPSDKHDKYSKYPGQVQSVSGSPLCHVSVTNWCKASKYGAVSSERSERCAKLTGDVAAHTVELLNAQADGKFVATYTPPATISQCMSCHGKKAMNNTRGLMDCVQCHEPHK